MSKEVFGKEVMEQFIKDLFQGESPEKATARLDILGCGFCPILWPVAISIAAVEFGLADVLFEFDELNANQLEKITDALAQAARLEEATARKLEALCKCNCPCSTP